MYNFFLEHVKCYHLRSTFNYHKEVGQIIKNIKQVNIIYMKNTERVSIGKYTLTVLNPNRRANPATALAVTSSLLPLTLTQI